MRIIIGGTIGILIAGAALAHQGAMGVVKDRMDAMGRVQADTKVIGDMARGRTAFDADLARAALDRMGAEAEQMSAVFERRDLSSPTEARALIWDEFDSFTAMAQDMALAAAGSAETPQELVQTLRAVGQTCAACHEKYRVESD